MIKDLYALITSFTDIHTVYPYTCVPHSFPTSVISLPSHPYSYILVRPIKYRVQKNEPLLSDGKSCRIVGDIEVKIRINFLAAALSNVPVSFSV